MPEEWWENDAEDSVKYLVKWRGLPFEAATWEEWGLVKHDAHAQVARFWAKERSPPSRALERRAMPPELKLYKRLLESPLFGLLPDEDGNYPRAPVPKAALLVGAPADAFAVGGSHDGAATAAAAGAAAVALASGGGGELVAVPMEADPAAHEAAGAAAAVSAAAAEPSGSGAEAGALASAAAAAAPVDLDAAAAGLRLREYQLEGVNWLVWNWFNSRPSILADEM